MSLHPDDHEVYIAHLEQELAEACALLVTAQAYVTAVEGELFPGPTHARIAAFTGRHLEAEGPSLAVGSRP